MTEEKLIKFLEDAEYFETANLNLLWEKRKGIIPSYDFQRNALKVIIKNKGSNELPGYLQEYSRILTELIIYEASCKIQNTLESL